MANEKNLIQVQSELQSPTIRDTDLVKYANGSNPSVPSFLALMEMNRRKQLAEGSKAFEDSNQQSIKDQLTNSLTAPTQMRGALTGAPAGQVNPAAAPTGIAMGMAPKSNIPQVNPAAAPAAPNTAPIPAITGAEGGLMSLPVGHFNESSYAGGGIVAFGDPARNPDEDQLVSFPAARASGPKVLTDAQIEAVLRSQGTGEAAPAAAPSAPAKGYQGILDSLPKVQAPEAKSLEQLYADRKAAEKMAGVSDDPYSDVKKRMQTTEERQAKENEGAGLDRLLAQLSAFSKADPAKGFGYAAAVSSDASRGLEKEQRALVDKQEKAQIDFSQAMAKEEDARRHKDADGVLAAQQAQQKAALDFQKAEHDRGMLAAHIYQTQENAGYHNRMAGIAEDQKPTAEDKKLLKVQTTVNAHPVVKSIADAIKQGTIEVGTEDYYKALRKINEIATPLYRQAGLTPPENIVGDINDAPAKKPGFWESIFGGSNKPASGGKTVSFDQLPK